MPQKMELLVGQVADCDDLILAWDGDFLQGTPFNVAIMKRYIALLTGILSMYSVVHIQAKLDASPDQTMFDPTAGDTPSTEPPNVRKS